MLGPGRPDERIAILDGRELVRRDPRDGAPALVRVVEPETIGGGARGSDGHRRPELVVGERRAASAKSRSAYRRTVGSAATGSAGTAAVAGAVFATPERSIASRI
jgi:hypothetical protein